MKKVGYLLTLLLGLFAVFNSLSVFNAASQVKARGVPAVVGPAQLDATMLASLGIVLGLVTLAGAIGGLTGKSWSKTVSLGAIGLLVLLLIYQSSIVMALILLVPAGLLLFG